MRPNEAARTGGLAAGYRAHPGTIDEMVDDAGAIRPAWRPLIDRLDWLDRAEVDARFARADHYLHDAGVYYRVYGAGGSNERAWPLAHVPLLIEEAEWQGIAAGLIQRAELLERVLADIYGDNRLVAEGLIPPELIAASPEYLRPMAGIAPPKGGFLHFVAFDLGRGPDGRWWVLGDRTQAPSGAGFALENRVATTRALSDIQSAMNVHRLAGFFRDLRDALFDLANDPTEVAILTPGQHTETYFEHAYIARYLGLLLLEGEDLTVTDGKVMVRTGRRPAAAQRALAAPRCRLHGPARTQARFAHRHAGPGRCRPPRRRHHRQCHRLGHPRDARAARLPARHLPPPERRGPRAAAHRHLVVRPGGRARACAGQSRPHDVGQALATLPPDHHRAGTLLGASLSAAERAALAERLAPPAVRSWRRNRSPCRPCPITPRAGSSRGR